MCSWDYRLFSSGALFCLFVREMLGCFHVALYLQTPRPKMKRKKISISPGTIRVCSIFCRGLWAAERRLLPALPGVAAADRGGVHVNTIYPHIPLLTAACSITSAKVRGEEGVSCSYSCGTAGDFLKIASTNKTEIIPSCSCSLHRNEKN